MRVLPVHRIFDFFGWIESKLLISLISSMYFDSKLTVTSNFFFFINLNNCFLLSSLVFKVLAVSFYHYLMILSVFSFFSKLSIFILQSFPSGWSAQFSIKIYLIFWLYFYNLFLICFAHMILPAFIGISFTLQILIFSVST